ncbi:MAG: phosphohydrolase [Thalassobius sp.]|nr:phosphohydrolase [Thalassovita sp.]
MDYSKTITQEILQLFEKYGREQYGEDITQEEHALQSAILAEREGFEDEVIIAALLHDIGHLFSEDSEEKKMGVYGIMSHEKVGADYLREKGFAEIVALLVEGHVEAKRYLTYKYPDYYTQLSEASKKTLEYQGGVMNDDEAKAFELLPHFKLNLKMREWDDMAKIEDLKLPTMADYKAMIEKHLEAKN